MLKSFHLFFLNGALKKGRFMQIGLQAIVLAAGKSKRFNTGNTKMLEKICGQELILYPITALERMNIPTTLVVGYQKEQIISAVEKRYKNKVNFIEQEQQLGTGDALLSTKKFWEKDNLLIMNGDMPLVTQDILQALITKHQETNAPISFVIAHNSDPSDASYGRIIQTEDQIKIIEARELSREQLQEHCCINAGIYLVKKQFLQENSNELQRNEVSKEFHVTDLVKMASEKGKQVSTISAPFDYIRGINTFQELWAVEQVKRAELIKYWMNKGVRFSVPQNVHIDLNVTIGAGTFIGCGVHILNDSKIGNNCSIDAFCLLSNAILEDNATIHSHCVIKNTTVKKHANIGPFAHLRDKAVIGERSSIGNFVEVKNSTIGTKTKAKHLSYLGDAQIGSEVNIGAGTITCNHNGTSKQKTTIEDNAYIGSNNSLVAPVTIHKNAYTAAGSVITDTVPADALAIARSRQLNKEGYAIKIREKNQQNNEKKNKQEKKDDTSSDSFSFIGAVKTNSDSTSLE